MLSLPKIEAAVSLKDQTASISPTNIITPPRSGMYRLSVYVEVTSGGAATVGSTIYFTDAHSAQSPIVQGGAGAQLGSPISDTMVLQAEPSAPIKFDATLSGGSGTYNIDVVLESL